MRPKKVLTDEQTGQLSDRLDEFRRRVKEGTLPFDLALSFLQKGSEGHLGAERVEEVEIPFWKPGEELSGIDCSLDWVMSVAKERGLQLMTDTEARRKLTLAAETRTDHDAFVIVREGVTRRYYSVMACSSGGRDRFTTTHGILGNIAYPHGSRFLFMRRE